MTQQEPDHDRVEEIVSDEIDFPVFFAAGEGVDEEDFVPAFYRVEGPNGPISYMNPNSGPFPATMWDLVMEAQSEHFRPCTREDTPFDESP